MPTPLNRTCQAMRLASLLLLALLLPGLCIAQTIRQPLTVDASIDGLALLCLDARSVSLDLTRHPRRVSWVCGSEWGIPLDPPEQMSCYLSATAYYYLFPAPSGNYLMLTCTEDAAGVPPDPADLVIFSSGFEDWESLGTSFAKAWQERRRQGLPTPDASLSMCIEGRVNLAHMPRGQRELYQASPEYRNEIDWFCATKDPGQ